MLAVRIDDVSVNMNLENFMRLIKILNKYNLKVLLGIIPDNYDEDLKKYDCLDNNYFIDIIDRLIEQGHSISMHGCHHRFHSDIGKPFITLNNYSEFSGLSYDVQYNLISYGKKKMEELGLKTNIFMAPAHTFDQNTLLALEDLGFIYISDGYGGKILNAGKLKLIPCSISKYKKTKRVNTICLHPNIMSNEDFLRLEEALRNNRDDFVDFKVLMDLSSKAKLSMIEQHFIVKYRKIKSFFYRLLKRGKL